MDNSHNNKNKVNKLREERNHYNNDALAKNLNRILNEDSHDENYDNNDIPHTKSSINKAKKDEQDIRLRANYSKAIAYNIQYQGKLRKKLANFYMTYVSIITLVIFYLIIDPFHTPSIYPLALKETLLGIFFTNIISVLVIMVRYSFQPSDKIMHQFNLMGNKNSK